MCVSDSLVPSAMLRVGNLVTNALNDLTGSGVYRRRWCWRVLRGAKLRADDGEQSG